MNNVGNKNLFQQVVSMLLVHFDLEQHAADRNENEIVALLHANNEQLVSLLNDLKNAETAYLFVRGDRELRQKVPDIWQLQCERSEIVLVEALAKLQSIGNSMELQFPQSPE